MTVVRENTIWRHFKGVEYYVLTVGKHSETQEDLVVYKNLNNEVWIRPLSMWTEIVERDGYKGPRFRLIYDPVEQVDELDIVSMHTFSVTYDKEDRVYVGRVKEYPSLAADGDTKEEALAAIKHLVADILNEFEEVQRERL